MSSKTDYLENAVINHFLRGSATGASSAYVGLFTVMPTESGGGTEVSAAGYSRQAGGFSAPSPAGETANASLISFGPAGASWGTVVGFGLFDASSGGNLLYYGTFAASKTVGLNDLLEILAGSLTVAEL